MSEPRFDIDQVFDEDYLYLYEPALTHEVSDCHADLIWRLLASSRGASNERIAIRRPERAADALLRPVLHAHGAPQLLRKSGFREVVAFDQDGNVLSAQSRRIVTVPTR